jgi:hypothetical protein
VLFLAVHFESFRHVGLQKKRRSAHDEVRSLTCWKAVLRHQKLLGRSRTSPVTSRPKTTLRANPPGALTKTGELLFVANAVNANNCARCVFDRLIAGDVWYAHNRALAVVWFTCVDRVEGRAALHIFAYLAPALFSLRRASVA